MPRLAFAFIIGACLLTSVSIVARGADKAADSLQGVWTAQSLEFDGKVQPAKLAARMRFTFKGDKLAIRGNFEDDREEECTFTIDSKQSPKQLNFTPPNEQKPVPGIYELTGDSLKLCLRHASSDAGRPTEFATKEGSKLILMVLKKQVE